VNGEEEKRKSILDFYEGKVKAGRRYKIEFMEKIRIR